jgi:hypothetical protein
LIALQLFQVSNKVVALVDCHGHVGVELGDSWGGDFGAGLADILRLEEELGGEICDGNRCGIIKSEGLDTGESNILGCRVGKRDVN